jgi:hypothetical protein
MIDRRQLVTGLAAVAAAGVAPANAAPPIPLLVRSGHCHEWRSYQPRELISATFDTAMRSRWHVDMRGRDDVTCLHVTSGFFSPSILKDPPTFGSCAPRTNCRFAAALIESPSAALLFSRITPSLRLRAANDAVTALSLSITKTLDTSSSFARTRRHCRLSNLTPMAFRVSNSSAGFRLLRSSCRTLLNRFQENCKPRNQKPRQRRGLKCARCRATRRRAPIFRPGGGALHHVRRRELAPSVRSPSQRPGPHSRRRLCTCPSRARLSARRV